MSKRTFIGGKQLLHSVFIANEVIDEAKRKKKKMLSLQGRFWKGIWFKVDFEKAYGSIS